jgi:hypothetical protein
VGPKAGLDVTEKRKRLPLPGIELWPSNQQPVVVAKYTINKFTGKGAIFRTKNKYFY